MRVTFFGTFDERSHPRVRALREGIEQGGHAVHVISMPLDLDTAARVSIAQRPWRAPILGIRLARCWFRLWRAGAGQHPDIVVVEGAGSPAEINLRAQDIANMGFARAAGVPVVLVGDIGFTLVEACKGCD